MDGFIFARHPPLQGIDMENHSLESTQKFFDLWLKTCDASLGKMAEYPAVGPARENMEKIMKGLPLFFNLYSVWIDSISDFQHLSLEAMNRMQDKTANMDGEISPEKYKELYTIWIETYSDTFKEFLRSGHFANDLGKFLSGFIDAQKYNREMLEGNYLKPMNLPTRTEIDELNKELYSLKKKVRELAEKVNELSSDK